MKLVYSCLIFPPLAGGIKGRGSNIPFFQDFVSFEKKIIIELDGGQHTNQKQKDQQRDKRLTEDGFTVLRFWNNDVLENIDAVLEIIRRNCIKFLNAQH